MNESITPSLICSDLCNLEASVKALEETGCQMLHVDILDGYFSPSMPLGLDTVRQLRKKTSLAFDAHVMAVDNTFFMEELADEFARIFPVKDFRWRPSGTLAISSHGSVKRGSRQASPWRQPRR